MGVQLKFDKPSIEVGNMEAESSPPTQMGPIYKSPSSSPLVLKVLQEKLEMERLLPSHFADK